MDTHTVLVLVAGVVAPLLNALLKQPTWDRRRTWLVTALTSIGLGGAATAISGEFTAEELVQAATGAWALGQTLYELLLKRTKLNEKLENTLVKKLPGDDAPEDELQSGNLAGGVE